MSKWPNERGLYMQLQRLADYISTTRNELSSLRPDQVKNDFLPKATDELDAIVEATAAATNRIMDAAEVVTDVAGRMSGEDSNKAMAAVTSIYEACTFQDITGQRVTKVINVLKVIEDRLDHMISAMGEIEASVPPAPTKQSNQPASQADIDAMFAAPAGKSTLDGPALPGQAKTQAEIDALFEGF